MSRRDALASALVDSDARVDFAFALLAKDAENLARLDWPAFRARVEALLFDLDTSSELLTALMPLCPAEETRLHERAQRVGDRRMLIHRWLKQIGGR